MRLGAAGLKASSKVTIPTLIIEAGNDRVVRISAENRVAARMKDCNTVVIADSGHVMMAETDPVRAQTIRAIEAFLAKSAP